MGGPALGRPLPAQAPRRPERCPALGWRTGRWSPRPQRSVCTTQQPLGLCKVSLTIVWNPSTPGPSLITVPLGKNVNLKNIKS